MNLFAFAAESAVLAFQPERSDLRHALAPLTMPCPSCGSLCDKHDAKPNGSPTYHCRNPFCRQPYPLGTADGSR